MLEAFRTWLNTIIISGIIFTIIRIIMPNNNMKKYITSIIGIVTIIVIGSPVIKLLNKNNLADSITKSIQDVIAVETMSKNVYEDYETICKNNVKESFKKKVEEDIKNKLQDKTSGVIDVNVSVSDAYNIEKINIVLSSYTTYDIVSYISEEYDVLKENITVQKGG